MINQSCQRDMFKKINTFEAISAHFFQTYTEYKHCEQSLDSFN